jgi:acyl-CoA dehydrogenase
MAARCHAQMYIMGTLLRHGSEAQKNAICRKIATGELRLQAFGVTEPTSGTDTTRLKTVARRDGDTISSTARRSGPAAPNIPT